ncbi:hypothetical protein V6N13_094985 [Hibiscus sabdariffa]
MKTGYFIVGTTVFIDGKPLFSSPISHISGKRGYGCLSYRGEVVHLRRQETEVAEIRKKMIGESIGVVETEGGNKEDGVGVNAKRLKLTSDKTGIVW